MTTIAGYERLPGDELEAQTHHHPHHHPLNTTINNNIDDALLGNELPVCWPALQNLDLFLTRIYKYWEEKGFFPIITARILNLAALAFTITISGYLLLFLDTSAFNNICLKKETCSIWDVAFQRHPFSTPGALSLWTVLSSIYVLLCTAYWMFSVVHFYYELRDLTEIRHFYNTHLGLSERAVHAATWPDVIARLVRCQESIQLSTIRTLTEHDIVNSIMRRDNYLIAMLNKGILALNIPIPGLRRHVLLTKTMEWNLYWFVLDPLFDHHHKIKSDVVDDVDGLMTRLRGVAVVNAVLSPFLLVFLVMYFFMKNAEALYHHPSTIGARRWSPLAKWKLREFNELPHFISHRLNAGYDAANKYLAQFPNYTLSHIARFIAFVAGSFAALIIALTLVDERFLEIDLVGGHQTVWWLALLGVILALCRALIIEQSIASFDPGLALLEVAAHTHYFPRRWRGRAHTLHVQEEFSSLFRYRFFLFLEELTSVIITPIMLWHSLPRCAPAILSFVQQNTASIDGIGDVCSYAAFDLRKHGNGEYGSPWTVPVHHRSQGGKLEKSVMSFVATYPMWDPSNDAKEMLLESILCDNGNNSVNSSSSSSGVMNASMLSSMMMMLSRGGGGGGGNGGIISNTTTNNNISNNNPMLSLLLSQYPHLAALYLLQQQQQQHGVHNNSNNNTIASATQRQYYKTTTTTMNDNKNMHQHTTDDEQHNNNNTTSTNDIMKQSVHDALFISSSPLLLDERVAVGYTMMQSYHDNYHSSSGSGSGSSSQHDMDSNTTNDDNIKDTNILSGSDHHKYHHSNKQTVTPAIDAPIRKSVSSMHQSGSGGSSARSFHAMSNELSVLSREPSGVSHSSSPQMK